MLKSITTPSVSVVGFYPRVFIAQQTTHKNTVSDLRERMAGAMNLIDTCAPKLCPHNHRELREHLQIPGEWTFPKMCLDFYFSPAALRSWESKPHHPGRGTHLPSPPLPVRPSVRVTPAPSRGA